ncbi:M48 family metalloprotease [Lysobacter sp. A03]|uniref:M48 family metalloprotease n=1 Tax=Lysobacter sp. A03 TaxID=1199154 RepID=UPI0005B75036|nr:M48 family metalloprotease [Lysobacter sp. A03]KIQ96907.1 putative Zn-dependent protease [Lysobacter sp. A03]
MKTISKRIAVAILPALLLTAGAIAMAAEMPAVVHKPSVEVRSAPDFQAGKIAVLKRNAAVRITDQNGLWYQLQMADGSSGYVRINDVRVASAGAETPAANSQALFGGNSGQGRSTETASVRGINETTLRTARSDAAGLSRLQSYSVSAESAGAHARSKGWQPVRIAWGPDAAAARGSAGQATQADKRATLSTARGLLSRLGGGAIADSAMRVADRAVGKSEQELAAEELELGPAIAGRVLGAAPLWANPEAQKRINLVGRWVASQTSRPQLPWTFGVIDDGEINAYAAPGGYILVTRGMYDLLDNDAELAAVIAHELGHVVQRDHYEVIRKQEIAKVGKDVAMAQVRPHGIAADFARDYVNTHGAAVMMSSLDRDAEYRADEAAGVYLARAGFDPLSFYAVLQKMAALGTRPARMSQLYRTHPPLQARMDRLDQRVHR